MKRIVLVFLSVSLVVLGLSVPSASAVNRPGVITAQIWGTNMPEMKNPQSVLVKSSCTPYKGRPTVAKMWVSSKYDSGYQEVGPFRYFSDVHVKVIVPEKTTVKIKVRCTEKYKGKWHGKNREGYIRA